jgi:hypothetical protein
MTQAQNLADLSQLYTSYPLGFRNRIINGDMRVAQRAAQSFGNNQGGYAGPDRYTAYGLAGPGVFTQAQVQQPGANKRCWIQQWINTVPTFSGDSIWNGISQIIEGFNCYDLVGQPIVLSFVFRCPVAGTFSVSIRDGGLTATYLTTFNYPVANAEQPITIKIPPVPANAVISNSGAAGLYVTIGAIGTGIYAGAVNAAWQPGISLTAVNGVTNWASAQTGAINVTELQLETGLNATSFERRPYPLELALCQRYYEVCHLGGITAYNQSNVTSLFTVPFAVTKRVSPTFSNSGIAGFTNENGIGTITNIQVDRGDVSHCEMLIQGTGGNTPATCSRVVGSATMYFSAEL